MSGIFILCEESRSLSEITNFGFQNTDLEPSNVGYKSAKHITCPECDANISDVFDSILLK